MRRQELQPLHSGQRHIRCVCNVRSDFVLQELVSHGGHTCLGDSDMHVQPMSCGLLSLIHLSANMDLTKSAVNLYRPRKIALFEFVAYTGVVHISHVAYIKRKTKSNTAHERVAAPRPCTHLPRPYAHAIRTRHYVERETLTHVLHICFFSH